MPEGADIFCTTSSFAIDTGSKTDPGAKNAPFLRYVYIYLHKNHQSTKTGSGQTSGNAEKTERRVLSAGVTDWQWWHIVGVNITKEFILGPDDLSPALSPHISYVAYDYFNTAGKKQKTPSERGQGFTK